MKHWSAPTRALIRAIALLLGLWSAQAAAQFDCQLENPPNFEFGDVGPAGSTTSITTSFTCYNRQDTVESATACMYFDPQSATDGVARARWSAGEPQPNTWISTCTPTRATPNWSDRPSVAIRPCWCRT